MALNKRDQILRDYADAVRDAASRHLNAIDKARKARERALAALEPAEAKAKVKAKRNGKR